MQSVKYHQIWNILKKNSFYFDSSLPCSLKCKLCDGILINAKQSPCGCRFCQECLILYLNNGNTACPGDDEECKHHMFSHNDCIDDNFANREISQLVVKCPYHSCNFEIMLKNIAEHMDTCKFNVCSEEELEDISFPDDANNFESQLLEEMVKCRFCGFEFTGKEIDMKHHNTDSEYLCNKFQAMCPYNCGLSELINWKSHIRVCINRPLSCPYLEFGCNADSILKMNMSDHLCNNGYEHTKILLEMITNLANEVKTGEMLMTSKDHEAKEVKNRLDNMEIELEEVKCRNLVLRDEIDNIRNEIAAMGNGFVRETNNRLTNDRSLLGDEIVHDLRRRGDDTDNRIKTLERSLELCDLKYEKKCLDYIWQIENFSRKSEDAKNCMDKSIVYSNPFFFMKNSYRLRLVLYPFNRNSGFISLFFQIMRNRFDEILDWPFKYDVSISIMDQEGQDDKVYHLFYDPTDENQQRVYCRPDTDCSESYGIANFIKRKALLASHNLLKNDTMFVKFSVKPINLSE